SRLDETALFARGAFRFFSRQRLDSAYTDRFFAGGLSLLGRASKEAGATRAQREAVDSRAPSRQTRIIHQELSPGSRSAHSRLNGGNHAVGSDGIVGDGFEPKLSQSLQQIVMRVSSRVVVVIFHNDTLDTPDERRLRLQNDVELAAFAVQLQEIAAVDLVA